MYGMLLPKSLKKFSNPLLQGAEAAAVREKAAAAADVQAAIKPVTL